MTDFKIQKGKPRLNGLYVCYVDDPIQPNWALEQVRHWHDDHWLGNPEPETVHGWIGPLPAFKHGETKPEDPQWSDEQLARAKAENLPPMKINRLPPIEYDL